MRRVNVNGDFPIWQMGTVINPCHHAVITADCWRVQHTITGLSVSVERSTDAPSFAEAGRYVGQSYKVTNLVAAAEPGYGGNIIITCSGEGHKWQGMHGRAAALAFWAKSNTVGVYHAGVRTGVAPYKTCSMEVPITAANVWHRFEFVLPVSPLDGGWSFGRDIGYVIFFALAGGAAYAGTPGIWEDGPKGIGPLQVNWAAVTDATFHLAGVSLEPDQVTPFEMQSEQDALRDCQRYIEKSFKLWTKPGTGQGVLNGAHLFHAPRPAGGGGSWQAPDLVRFATPKRTDDYAVSFYNPETAGNDIRNWSAGTNLGSTAADAKTEFGFRLYGQGGDLGDTLAVGWVADASVQPG